MKGWKEHNQDVGRIHCFDELGRSLCGQFVTAEDVGYEAPDKKEISGDKCGACIRELAAATNFRALREFDNLHGEEATK